MEGSRSDESACSELSCAELIGVAEDYFGLRLPPAEQARFEMHLAECGRCRAYLKQVCRTIGTAQELRTGAMPPAVREQLVVALRAARDRSRSHGDLSPK